MKAQGKVMKNAWSAYKAKKEWAKGWGEMRQVPPFAVFLKNAWAAYKAEVAREAANAIEAARITELRNNGILINGAVTYQVVNGRAKWTHTFGNYNDRRMGKPWGARVGLVNNKIELDFAGVYDVDGHKTNAGTLTVWADVGVAVAMGQKDSRGQNYLAYFAVRDGEVMEVSKADLR